MDYHESQEFVPTHPEKTIFKIKSHVVKAYLIDESNLHDTYSCYWRRATIQTGPLNLTQVKASSEIAVAAVQASGNDPKLKLKRSFSSSGVQLSGSKKRPYPSGGIELNRRGDVAEGQQSSSAASTALQGPLCRPWDRGDFMRRLSTFKSMSWFAKPKVVSAVNCASRGWINVDIDTIACEACGARLLFSTPASWNQQQVEKAALVFSLKLDNGHKLLCPWIDNACSETLARFPPTTPEILVENFREHCFALLQLSALPRISSSAIAYIQSQSPLLEDFLGKSLMLECGYGSTENSGSVDFNSQEELKLYYQVITGFLVSSKISFSVLV
ncbi:uncharacterized protein LOC124834966 [Vigna umbellata]|uniref:uncharacterized protein LOC124834966 n=1 Tax=Vigna umbellata TaxID=87088 RepID=UPI001F5ECF65|nr:uncharacterized protein LOC124834966 [Vigna umbellata]